MSMLKIPNRKGDKIYFHFDYGRGKGQRPSTGIFIYTKPNSQLERNHNKESVAIIERKKSEMILDQQATGSGYIPAHKFEKNFLNYYENYVGLNKGKANRHLEGSFKHFKAFVNSDSIAPIDITHNLCLRFRKYLLDRFHGETPCNYFSRFKGCLKAATRDGYWRTSPCDEVVARSNPSTKLKENLEVEEYLSLLHTPFFNYEISESFIFCCYTGLRFVDVEDMRREDFSGNRLTTRLIQAKTGQPVILTLHPIAKAILEKRRATWIQGKEKEKIFRLPSHDGCNKELQKWVTRAGIEKHITWSCARLSFSILLKDKNVDDATIAYLLGHMTTEQVQKTYKRHRPRDQQRTMEELPSPAILPYFLQF